MRLAASIFWALLASAMCVAGEGDYEPTASYKKETIHGFTVLISQRVLEHPGPAGDATKLLDEKLKNICAMIAPEVLAKLQKTTLWMEWELVKNSAACAHHSPEWLRNNGRNPEKVGSVEISNTRLFIAWTPVQPMMILHELAHYYHHHQLDKAGRETIKTTYDAAMKSGIYESVEYNGGAKKKAYAANNESEYFGEISEAYFGKNDFYPYTTKELEAHDPKAFEMLKKLWGEPVVPKN